MAFKHIILVIALTILFIAMALFGLWLTAILGRIAALIITVSATLVIGIPISIFYDNKNKY